jgi:hypothetical protein
MEKQLEDQSSIHILGGLLKEPVKNSTGRGQLKTPPSLEYTKRPQHQSRKSLCALLQPSSAWEK